MCPWRKIDWASGVEQPSKRLRNEASLSEQPEAASAKRGEVAERFKAAVLKTDPAPLGHRRIRPEFAFLAQNALIAIPS